jgi:hypothetical protein
MRLNRKANNEHGERWSLLHAVKVQALDGTTLIDRFRIIQTPWFGLLLHRLRTADDERALHNHPWPFWSLVLRGGYVEKIEPAPVAGSSGMRVNDTFSLHSFRLDQRHRIAWVAPGTVTLVLTGRRKQAWGFYTDDARFILAEDYKGTS